MIADAILMVYVDMDGRGCKLGRLGGSARLMQRKHQSNRGERYEQNFKTEFDGHRNLRFRGLTIAEHSYPTDKSGDNRMLGTKIVLLRSELTDFVNYRNATMRL